LPIYSEEVFWRPNRLQCHTATILAAASEDIASGKGTLAPSRTHPIISDRIREELEEFIIEVILVKKYP
jgi:hypothetical protein